MWSCDLGIDFFPLLRNYIFFCFFKETWKTNIESEEMFEIWKVPFRMRMLLNVGSNSDYKTIATSPFFHCIIHFSTTNFRLYDLINVIISNFFNFQQPCEQFNPQKISAEGSFPKIFPPRVEKIQRDEDSMQKNSSNWGKFERMEKEKRKCWTSKWNKSWWILFDYKFDTNLIEGKAI